MSEKKHFNKVYRTENEIYLYSEHLNMEVAFDFITKFKSIDKELSSDASSKGYKSTKNIITIHLFSWGGYIDSSNIIYDTIRLAKSKTKLIIEGDAASGGAIIALAADERHITKNSTMLIHELQQSLGYQRHSEFKVSLENQKMLEKLAEEIYLTRTKLTKKQLDQILTKDITLNAEKCLEYGLVHKII